MSGQEATTALGEAARWRLLGLLFERPRPGWHDELRTLAAEVGDERLRAAAAAARAAEEGDYLAMLGPGGAATPREAGYRPMADPGKILADLAGLYAAFGYDPAAEDPADHVAVEVGFVGFLRLKQAYASHCGDAEAERAVRRALQAFLTDHLAILADGLGRRVDESAPAHLRHAAALLDAWCPRPSRPRLAVVGRTTAHERDGDDAGFDCGGCAAG